MRTFVASSLLATLLAAPAAAQVLPPAAKDARGGTSTTQSFPVSASLGNACFMTDPADYTLLPTLYWTASTSFFSFTADIASFTVRCNRGTVYSVTWQGATGYTARTGDAQGPFGGNTDAVLLASSPYIRLFLNGNTSSSSSIDVRLGLRRVSLLNVALPFNNPQTAGTGSLSNPNRAATTTGERYLFNARFAANNSLSQVDVAGQYSGTVVVILTVQ